MKKLMSFNVASQLRHLVTVVFMCLILTLFFAPALAARIQGGPGSLEVLFEGATPQNMPSFLRALYMVAMLWFPVMWMLALAGGNWLWPTLTVFLLALDILLAVKLWRIRRSFGLDGFTSEKQRNRRYNNHVSEVQDHEI